MAGDSNDSSPVDIDLDAFEKELYAPAPEPDQLEEEEETSEKEEVADTEDDHLETDDDSDSETDSEEEKDEDEDKDKEPESRKERRERRQNRLQKRIDDLTARAYAAEREAEELRKLHGQTPQTTPQTAPPQNLRDALPEGAPDFDAVDENGQPVYPLGQFDPRYVTDLSNWNFDQRMAAAKAKEAHDQEVKEFQEAQNALIENWDAQLNEYAEKENPEIREDILDLAEEFEGIDPQYGDFLATTIMLSENGPAIMEYLSKNIGEARQIVASGPAAATRAIGRLEARLTRQPTRERDTESESNKKVSAAPPPPTPTRGRSGGRSARADTDNLDAFEKLLYGGN